VRSVDLAIYADALAGEAAALAARRERERSHLRQAAIERAARAELPPPAVARLEELGLLTTRADGAKLRELEQALEAVEQLQAWVEARLAASAA
jgi:hypothetical protein